MAGVNKLIQFGTWELGTENTLTDDELVALSSAEKQGIALGSVAYTNILNALMRQVTLTSKAFGDVVADKADSDVDSSIDPAGYSAIIELAIENIAKEVAVTKDTISFTGTKSGVTVNAQGLVTNVVALVAGDIPSLAISKITGLQTALDAKVPQTRTLAGLDLSANRSRDDLIGISTGTGIIKRTSANTYAIYTLIASDIPSLAISKTTGLQTALDAKTDKTTTIAGLDLSTNRSRDDIIGMTTVGLVKRTAANTYAAYTLVASDIPSLATSKITGLDTALSNKVPTSRTIAGLDLTADRTLDAILGVSTVGLLKRSAANTLVIDNTAYVPQSRTIFGFDLSANRTLDTLLNISTNGILVRTGANTLGIDTNDYALSNNVALTHGDMATNLTLWKGTQAEYTALGVYDDDTLYFIEDDPV